MSEALPEFRLGIIGGCMTHQRGVPFNGLYHRQLSEMLLAATGIRLRTHVVRAFDDALGARLERLFAEATVDGVLIHLRSTPLVWSARFLERSWRDGRYRVELNPAIFRRARNAQNQAYDVGTEGDDAYGGAPDEQNLPPKGRRIAGFRVRNLNVAAGTLIGLDRMAIRSQLREFTAAERLARARRLPVFVCGPTAITYSWWTMKLVSRAERAIAAMLSGTEVPFALVGIDRNAAGGAVLRADGTHLTVEGHALVAERLVQAGIGPWMEEILARQAGAEPAGRSAVEAMA